MQLLIMNWPFPANFIIDYHYPIPIPLRVSTNLLSNTAHTGATILLTPLPREIPTLVFSYRH